VRDEATGHFNHEEFAAVRMSAANYYRRPGLPCAELNTLPSGFVDCLRWSGRRIGDAMERSRLDAKNRTQLQQEKTGHVFVPIPAPVAEAMRMLAGDRYFFRYGHNYPGAMRNYQYALKTLFKRAGISHGHAHRLRDTFAVEMLLAGVPLEQVSKLLGHFSVKTTEKHYAP
jgi:integrase